MARKASASKRGQTASDKNQDGASEETRDDEHSQKISDALRRLDKLRKAPADVITLFQVLADDKKHGSNDFDHAAAQWSPDQILAAIELGCLCALTAPASRLSSASPIAIRELGFWYADAVDRRLTEMIHDMLPDFERGKKVREKGAQNHGTPKDRFRRCRQLRAISGEILVGLVWKRRSPNSLSRIRLHKLVAEKYNERYGKSIGYKTVERDFAEWRKLKKKLDEPGLSR